MAVPSRVSEAREAAAPQQWRVRTENGSVFGPADRETLQAWARDGRLAPGHVISPDGKNWTPVTRLSELDMDWVAEISPGTFYGPIHHDALDELVRDGSLTPDAPLFLRTDPAQAATAAALQAGKESLERRVEELRDDFAARTAALESELRQMRGEGEQLRGQLAAKDLEFEAERQEHRAAVSRHQAELARRDARCASLEREQERLTRLDAERPALDARLADCERQLAAAGERLAAARREAEQPLQQARQAQRDAERALAAEQASHSGRDRELAGLREGVRSLRLRHESLRKLLQQAVSALGQDEAREAPEVIEAEPVAPSAEAPPPRAPVSMADLEAQAQREIRRLGGKGANPFARK